jgi:hypothetical protein
MDATTRIMTVLKNSGRPLILASLMVMKNGDAAILAPLGGCRQMAQAA